MRWSEILRNTTDDRFYGSRLASDPALGRAFGIRKHRTDLLSGLNSEEDHGPWPLSESPDVLVLGCSVSAGQNLPRNFSWPWMLRHFDGLVVNSVARTGSSTIRQIAAGQILLGTLGKPSSVLALLPNLDRAWLPGLIRTENRAQLRFFDALYIPEEPRYTLIQARYGEELSRSVRYLERTDPALVLAHTHQILDLWHLICSNASIDLRISSWHAPTNDVLADLFDTHRMPEYAESAGDDWRIDARWGIATDTGCGHEPQNAEQEGYWLRADDQIHPGLHHQIHFYETLSGHRLGNEEIASL